MICCNIGRPMWIITCSDIAAPKYLSYLEWLDVPWQLFYAAEVCNLTPASKVKAFLSSSMKSECEIRIHATMHSHAPLKRPALKESLHNSCQVYHLQSWDS